MTLPIPAGDRERFPWITESGEQVASGRIRGVSKTYQRCYAHFYHNPLNRRLASLFERV